MGPRGRARRLNPDSLGVVLGYAPPLAWARGPVQVPSPQDRHPSGHSCVNTALHPQKQALRHRRRARKAAAHLRPGALRRCARPCPALVAFASGGRRDPVGVRTRWRGGSGWLARGERIEPWPINEPNCFRSGMPQPRDPARASSAPRQTKKTADPARRPRPPQGPVTAREWDVAHAAALRALLTEPPAVLPNQVGGHPQAAVADRDQGRPPGRAAAWGRAGSFGASASSLSAARGTSWPVLGKGRCAMTWMGELLSRSARSTAREP